MKPLKNTNKFRKRKISEPVRYNLKEVKEKNKEFWNFNGNRETYNLYINNFKNHFFSFLDSKKNKQISFLSLGAGKGFDINHIEK